MKRGRRNGALAVGAAVVVLAAVLGAAVVVAATAEVAAAVVALAGAEADANPVGNWHPECHVESEYRLEPQGRF